MRKASTDYLVVGAGAMGMAFADALIDHADVHVTLVDRRFAAGGHWQDAYPFVQLHQASIFYGVASTVLGTGAVQQHGPEAGLQQRARRAEIQAYFDEIVHRRFLGTGRVDFLATSEYHTDGTAHLVTSRVSGESVEIDVRRRVVDATYLSPTIPATTPPPFGVADGVHVVPVNELPDVVEAPRDYVIVGAGKTATDAIVWLLLNGVETDRIVWVRPRDPWMLNRALVQPDPAVAIGLSADIMSSAADATSLDDMFLRLEAAGVMLRVDRDVAPTMAKTPTLGTWELDLLRSIERVVRKGHVRQVDRDEMVLDEGVVPLARSSLVVHCAASGLQYPPMVPIWGADKIRLQTIRVGFPCFCAALAGYVEGTHDDDGERNRLCPPNLYGNSAAEWALMQARGTVAAATFGAEPDIAEWAHGCALNPGRVSPAQRAEPAVQAASARLADHAQQGLARLSALATSRHADLRQHVGRRRRRRGARRSGGSDGADGALLPRSVRRRRRHLPYRRAAMSFMRWQLQRGVLPPPSATRPGSPWWRAVNERILRDGCEAVALSGDLPGPASSPTVDHWMSFVDGPTARSWYRAHNGSVVTAYLEHRDLAEAENAAERFFMNVVLCRVLFTHALVAAPRLSLGWLGPVAPLLGDPRLGMTGIFLSLSRVLPAEYPLRDGVATYLDSELGFGRLLDYGVIVPRLQQLYEWSARDLDAPGLLDCVRDGALTYAWPWEERHVWEPPDSMVVRVVHRTLPPAREEHNMGDDPASKKRRRIRLVQRYLVNPPAKAAVWCGFVPGYVIVETSGRRSGKRRHNVVGMHVEAGTGWVIAEHGRHAGYVNNLEANPDVRVRMQGRWRDARARILDDDDPEARLAAFGRRAHEASVRRFGTDLLTIQFELQPA